MARKASRKGPVYPKLVPTSESQELSHRLIDALCRTVERGNFRYVACQRAGVSWRRYTYWMELAAKERRQRDDGKLKGKPSMYVHLLERLEQSEGEVHAQCVEDVLDSDDARLKMEYLKLRFSKLYSKNPNSVDDETGRETKIDARELLRERLLAILGPPSEDG